MVYSIQEDPENYQTIDQTSKQKRSLKNEPRELILTLSGQSSRNREVLLCNAALTIVARKGKKINET